VAWHSAWFIETTPGAVSLFAPPAPMTAEQYTAWAQARYREGVEMTHDRPTCSGLAQAVHAIVANLRGADARPLVLAGPFAAEALALLRETAKAPVTATIYCVPAPAGG
jgi:hypothetical protein